MNSKELMNNDIYMNMINQNVAFIKNVAKKNNANIDEYKMAVVLGSGLSTAINDMEIDFIIEYKDMPFMSISSVKGHKSRFIFGMLNSKKVIVMDGRFHYYEGYSLRELTMPQRVFAKLGIEKIIITNAAGASNVNYNIGDVMIFKDHVNLTGLNPLIGDNLEEFGERFIPINGTYDIEKIEKIYKIAKENNIPVHKGVYMWFTGPSFETFAEVNIMQKLGVDARAMSALPEIVVARHCKMEVMAFSCITNVTKGYDVDSHNEVLENANKASENLKKVLKITMEVM